MNVVDILDLCDHDLAVLDRIANAPHNETLTQRAIEVLTAAGWTFDNEGKPVGSARVIEVLHPKERNPHEGFFQTTNIAFYKLWPNGPKSLDERICAACWTEARVRRYLTTIEPPVP